MPLPCSIFMNAHTHYLQQLHKVGLAAAATLLWCVHHVALARVQSQYQPAEPITRRFIQGWLRSPLVVNCRQSLQAVSPPLLIDRSSTLCTAGR